MRLSKPTSVELVASVMIILTELTLTSVVLSQQLNHAFDYGASCTADFQCDNQKFLQCNMETLRCDCTEGLQRNFNIHQCMRMEGWTCRKNGPNCTLNSSCVAGNCVCDDDYLPNGFGVCHLTHGMPCSEGSRICSWLQYLECPQSYAYNQEERRCKCLKEGLNFTWDAQKEKCVALAGSECDLDLHTNKNGIDCVANSFCNYQEVCECKSGYSVTKDKHCLLKFGEKCDNSQQEFCNKYDFLNCQDGKCNCEFFNQMKYDENEEKCKLLSGEPCGWPINGSHGKGNLAKDYTQFSRNGLDDRVHTCVPGAVCVARNEHGRGLCACVDGKREADDKTCEDTPLGDEDEDFVVLKTISPCTDLPHRGNSVIHGCYTVNPSKRLSCTVESGATVCTCGEGAFFNGTDCINFPGQDCLGIERSNECAPNSVCNATEGVCTCLELFQLETETSSCKPAYDKGIGQQLEFISASAQKEDSYDNFNYTSNGEFSKNGENISDGSCASLNYELERMKCFCEMLGSKVTWSDAGRLCVGLVGAPCKLENNINFLCIENSKCDLDEGSCQCEEDYYQTQMDVCLLDDGLGIDYRDYMDQDDAKPKPQHSILSNSQRPSSNNLFITLVLFILTIWQCNSRFLA